MFIRLQCNLPADGTRSLLALEITTLAEVGEGQSRALPLHSPSHSRERLCRLTRSSQADGQP